MKKVKAEHYYNAKSVTGLNQVLLGPLTSGLFEATAFGTRGPSRRALELDHCHRIGRILGHAFVPKVNIRGFEWDWNKRSHAGSVRGEIKTKLREYTKNIGCSHYDNTAGNCGKHTFIRRHNLMSQCQHLFCFICRHESRSSPFKFRSYRR